MREKESERERVYKKYGKRESLTDRGRERDGESAGVGFRAGATRQ